MSNHNHALFGRNKRVQRMIDDFFDRLEEGAIVFKDGMAHYLTESDDARYEQRLEQIDALENQADDLRRDIETALYEHMLVPDVRSDMLRLLDRMDTLMDICKKRMLHISIEQPNFGEEMCGGVGDLVEAVTAAMVETVGAARKLMRDPQAVRDHVHKIMFHEKDADRLGTELKRCIFASSEPLERKLLLRDWVDSIDELADASEGVGDLLSIIAIKRTL